MGSKLSAWLQITGRIIREKARTYQLPYHSYQFVLKISRKMLSLGVMKQLLFLIFTLSSLATMGQDEILDIIKEKHKASPTDAIIYVDSLLFANTDYDEKFIYTAKYYQAISYQKNNNHQKTLKILDDISGLMNKNGELFVKTLLQQSYSNMRLKNHTDATSQALEALDVAKKNELNDLIISANDALSFIHYSNEDYLKALEFLLGSAKLQKQLNDSTKLSGTYNNIAIIYKNTGSFKQALAYNQLSLDISILQKHAVGIGKSYSNIGRLYEFQGEFSKALNYYKKAADNNAQFNISNSIPYRNMGDVYFSMKDYERSKKSYLKALDIEFSSNNQSVLHNIYNNLLKIALQKEDLEKAFKYQTKSDSVYKIILAHENEDKIKMLEKQYKLSNSEKELKQEQDINNKNRIIFGILTGLLLLLGLYWFQSTKNTKLKLAQEKLLLEQKVLRSQMNPHFIFNALSAIQNSLLDNDPIKSASYLSRFAKLIRQNFDFINQKSIPLKDEIDALKNYMDTQKLRFQDKFDYEINIFADVDINLVEVPPLLIQPFIENSIEHGFKNKKEKGKITINVSRQNDRICYEILDNGIGLPTAVKDGKLHAIDIFKQRLKLLNNKDENSFTIKTSEQGTRVYFCLTQ